MSERGAPSLEALEACTAVLMTVPREVASRLETFLLANGVACRTRGSTLTPEQLAEEALRQASPTAASLLDSPVGRLFKGKLQRDLRAEIELHASGFEHPYDVLVRPEDLPAGLVPAAPATDEVAGPEPPAEREPAAAPATGGGSDPWARPGEAAPASAEDPVAQGATPEVPAVVAASGAAAPVVLCQLPWDQAWALVARLADAGIAAAVMEAESAARDVPMADRMVPVGVEPENLERARGLL
jgi:hypothetical protein